MAEEELRSDYVTLDQLPVRTDPEDTDIMLLQQTDQTGKQVTVKKLREHVTADIVALIPDQANEDNQLADKEFVNSSINTNTANFRGTFNSLEELRGYAGPKTRNDYAFVITSDSEGNTAYNRYKWNDTAWIFEYTLNNSSFTAEQWAAITSGITAEKVAQISVIEVSQQEGNAIEEKADGLYVSASSAWSGTEDDWDALDKSTLKDKTQINIKNDSADLDATLFAICDTAANVQVKEIEMGIVLKPGVEIKIMFNHGNTAGSCVGTNSNQVDPAVSPRISINGGLGYPIMIGGEYAGEGFIRPGDVHNFVFTGNSFVDLTADVIYQGETEAGNYVKKRNGLIEEWKRNLTPAWDVIKIIEFPLSFTTEPIVIFNDIHQSANSSFCHYSGKIMSINPSQFKYIGYNYDGITWFAYGK